MDEIPSGDEPENEFPDNTDIEKDNLVEDSLQDIGNNVECSKSNIEDNQNDISNDGGSNSDTDQFGNGDDLPLRL